MALYMYQVAFTAEAVAALIKEPEDRTEAVRPALGAEGGNVLAYGCPFGEYDALVVWESGGRRPLLPAHVPSSRRFRPGPGLCR